MHISKNCSSHLLQTIIQLEGNAVTNSQYHERDAIEINLVIESLVDRILEQNICKALSPIGVNVTPEQFHFCDILKIRGRHCQIQVRKQTKSVLFNQNTFQKEKRNLLQTF